MKVFWKIVLLGFSITLLSGCNGQQINNSEEVNAADELQENKSLAFAIVNNGNNEDEIEKIVLAGTDSVVLAEIEIEAKDGEYVIIGELSFIVPGDFTTTLDNARIVVGYSIIADDANIFISDSDTIIEFEDDFTIEQSSGKISALLVADIAKITNQGGEISAITGDITISLDGILVKGDSHINIDITGNETSDPVTVVPALVNVFIDDELGANDSDAVISFSVDKGNNDIEKDSIYIYSLELEKAVGEPGLTIRNDDNERLAKEETKAYMDFSEIYDIMASFKIVDGDEYEFSVENNNDEVKIISIVYWVDLDDDWNIDSEELFEIINDGVIDLGKYGAD